MYSVREKNEYTNDYRKEKSVEGKLDKFFDNATIYFSKSTNRELYQYRNILEFSDDRYILTNPISDENIREMRNNMSDADLAAFDAFLDRNWGIKPPKMLDVDESYNVDLETVKKPIQGQEVVTGAKAATAADAKQGAQNQQQPNAQNEASTYAPKEAGRDMTEMEKMAKQMQADAIAKAKAAQQAGANQNVGTQKPTDAPNVKPQNPTNTQNPEQKPTQGTQN